MDKTTVLYRLFFVSLQRVIYNGKNDMLSRKDGFQGERSVILPPWVVDMEAQDPLVSSLYITDIGHYPQAKYHHRVRKIGISQYVLIYCVDGSGFYRLGDKTYEVKRNQYFILPSGVPHEYGATEGEKWTIYWVHFQGEHAEVLAEGAQRPLDVKPALNSHISERNNIFEEILAALHFGENIEDLRYASCLLHYYLASLRYLRQYRSTARYESEDSPRSLAVDRSTGVVDAAIHYMKENMERRITLQDLLDFTGYSTTQFTTLFKRHTGYSPMSYFLRMKMGYACRLLETTDLRVNEICFRVGIEDSLYFSRVFSKVMGLSPSAYRLSKGGCGGG